MGGNNRKNIRMDRLGVKMVYRSNVNWIYSAFTQRFRPPSLTFMPADYHTITYLILLVRLSTLRVAQQYNRDDS